MKNETALNHIISKGTGSRTIIFNSIMAAITTFALAISIVFQEEYPLIKAVLDPTLVFISSIGNIVLYGMTHVKHKEDRNV